MNPVFGSVLSILFLLVHPIHQSMNVKIDCWDVMVWCTRHLRVRKLQTVKEFSSDVAEVYWKSKHLSN